MTAILCEENEKSFNISFSYNTFFIYNEVTNVIHTAN